MHRLIKIYYVQEMHKIFEESSLQRLIKEESSAVDPVNIALSDYSSLSSSGASDNEEEIPLETETGRDGNGIRRILKFLNYFVLINKKTIL